MVCCSLAFAAQPAPAFVAPALKRAVPNAGVAGLAGAVGVKVEVTTSGRAGAVSINFSTNPADDAAALATARASTYVPARRDGHPTSAYTVFLLQVSAAGRVTFSRWRPPTLRVRRPTRRSRASSTRAPKPGCSLI